MRTTLLITGAGLLALSMSAHAQTTYDSDVVTGSSYRDSAGVWDNTGLPGVSLRDGVGVEKRRGPGGLQNNVGAIGVAAPSISGSNPLPLQKDQTETGSGIPLGGPIR